MHAPKASKPNTTSVQTHLQNALASHKSDPHTAKKHALKAVNALHRSSAMSDHAPEDVAAGGPC